MIRLDRLEYHIREELNKTAPRMMVVLHPLKVCISCLKFCSFITLLVLNQFFLWFQVVITNLEVGSVMDLDAKKWPDAQIEDSSAFYKVWISKLPLQFCFLKGKH